MMPKQESKRLSRKKPVRAPRMLRLLPVTVTMLSLLLIIKTNELYFESRKLRELYAIREASAEEKKDEKKDEKKSEEKKSEEKKGEAKKEESSHGDKKEEKAEENKDKGHGDKKEENADKKDEKKDEKSEGDKKEEKKDDKKNDEKKEGDKKEGDKKAEEEPKTFGTGKSTVKEIEEKKAKAAQALYSKTEIDLLQNLSKRREELDSRERDLNMKSMVLEATEKRITDRMTEMKTLEAEMQKVVAQYNDKQNDQLKSLVKIYENMKPDEAAAIFNEMEMPILLDVIGRMSERKVAPVLANMKPQKAKDVTQELAEKRKKAASMAAAASASSAGVAKAPAAVTTPAPAPTSPPTPAAPAAAAPEAKPAATSSETPPKH